MRKRVVSSSMWVLAAAAVASPSLAGGGNSLRLTQAHGFTFSEIGDVGNPGFAWDAPGPTPEVAIGGVDYRYRIATTEVNRGQWFEFLNAFAPQIPALGLNANSSALLGGCDWAGSSGGIPQFTLREHTRPYVSEMGWRFAAIYCNWLHNGAPARADAAYADFANGAYDISTFTTNPDGTYNDQVAHNPDAKFWIPTRDEWHKAGYWDPNRYGEGEGGYWLYPNGTDERLQFGLPGEGGETNFGMDEDAIPGIPLAVGSYSDVQSPWGLLDVSGGVSEWTEDAVVGVPGGRRYLAGTRFFQDENELTYGDHLGWNFRQTGVTIFANGGLRIAAAIPSPGVSSAIAVGCLLALRRRR